MSLVIGAAGAVGKRLIGALTARGEHVVAAMRSTPLPDHLQVAVARQVMGVDQGDITMLRKIFKRHPEIHTVWNMSVVRARNADTDTTVNGMKNITEVMSESGVKRLIWTDTIASFGAQAPRTKCSARWLTENPEQDPGSDIGVQKREVRRVMKQFLTDQGGDPRWAIVPCVLHTENVWGPGLTSYPLDALRAASDGFPYSCPVDPDVQLPMILVDDLVRGLLDLADAPTNMLYEPARGYCIPGFSCSANELFAEIRKHIPEFETVVEPEAQLNDLARLWPDTLSLVEAGRDLGYRPGFPLEATVQRILRAHQARRAPKAVMAELASVGDPNSMSGW